MLKGLVSLVTGGASGLGLATVQRMIQQGGRVVLCDLPTSQAHTLPELEHSDRCLYVPMDITSESDAEQALGICKDKFGRLDVLVNCAGIAFAREIYNKNAKKPFNMEEFDRLVKVNVGGTFNMVRLAAAIIAENEPDHNQQCGVIVNTSGIAAYDGVMGQAAYSATQAAITGMTLPLARDLASLGIRVCTIAPGLFDTPLLQALPEDIQAFLAETVPFPRRLGRPDEFAMMVQTIITNPLLNGEVIRLDGALRLQ